MKLLDKRGAILLIGLVFTAIIGLSVWSGLTLATGLLLIAIALITYGAFSLPGPYQWTKWVTVGATLLFSLIVFSLESRDEQIILFICLLTPMVGYAARFLVLDNARIPAVAVLVIVFSNLALWVLGFQMPDWTPNLHSGVSMNILRIQTIVAFIGGLIIILEVVSFIYALQKESINNKESLGWLSLIMNLISHNLRTPMTNASMSQQMLEMSVETDSPHQKHIEAIGRAIGIMDDTTNRLIRAGGISDFVNGRTNDEVIEQFTKAYPGIIIQVRENHSIAGKLNIAIQLAIEVFVDNAKKHGGERVELCFCSKRVKIMDNGKGLTDEQLEQFGKLTSENASKAKLHGIGINFALRVLEAVGWAAIPSNTEDGFEVVLEPTDIAKNNLTAYLSKS